MSAETKKGFDLAALMKGVSDLNTGREQIEYLPFDRIDPDPDNFYSLDGLNELADNIALFGLIDPIRVRPNGERYTVTSGHRRRAAIQLLLDSGEEKWKEAVPCLVDHGEATPEFHELKLIFANSATRQLSSAELSKQAERVEELLYKLKEQGYEFPGRMRDHVAQAVNVNKSKLARLHAIRSRAHEYILEAFDEGKINESVAYAFQRLPLHVQRRIWVNQIRLCYRVDCFTAEEVEKLGQLYQKLVLCNCKKSSVPCTCTTAESRFDRAQMLSHLDCSLRKCQRGMCCLGCADLDDCEDLCHKCSDDRKVLLAEQEARDRAGEAERQKRQAAFDRVWQEEIENAAAIWARIRKAANAAGLELREVLAKFCEDHDTLADFVAFACGEKPDKDGLAEELLEDELESLADELRCSTDFLLGRTNVPELNTVAAPEWQTGEPPRAGRYFCRVKGNADADDEPPKEFRLDWDGEIWYFSGRPILKGMLVLDWWPLPDSVVSRERGEVQ